MHRLFNLVVALFLTAGCATAPVIVHDRSGARTTLDDLKGHAVILTFWAEWCDPCLQQMPVLMSAAAAHGDQVLFLPVYLQEKPGHGLDPWLASQPDWFRDQACWANQDFLNNYDRTALPRTYVLGRNGHQVEQFNGKIDAERSRLLEASLLRALAATR